MLLDIQNGKLVKSVYKPRRSLPVAERGTVWAGIRDDQFRDDIVEGMSRRLEAYLDEQSIRQADEDINALESPKFKDSLLRDVGNSMIHMDVSASPKWIDLNNNGAILKKVFIPFIHKERDSSPIRGIDHLITDGGRILPMVTFFLRDSHSLKFKFPANVKPISATLYVESNGEYGSLSVFPRTFDGVFKVVAESPTLVSSPPLRANNNLDAITIMRDRTKARGIPYTSSATALFDDVAPSAEWEIFITPNIDDHRDYSPNHYYDRLIREVMWHRYDSIKAQPYAWDADRVAIPPIDDNVRKTVNMLPHMGQKYGWPAVYVTPDKLRTIGPEFENSESVESVISLAASKRMKIGLFSDPIFGYRQGSVNFRLSIVFEPV